ncbi:KilA-N domain-containing protein [Spirosoma aerolatum]|uniref:KilA-N domain-containing protein n=1 Tax=Spirosoma aerolatum TaxID=1211326 RepID=UPI0009AC4DBD|nr:KilA-N domain-containing protein [Spirosoma aerolatum]
MKSLIRFNGHESAVRRDADGFYSLTDLWRLAGSDENKAPAQWQKQDETKAYIKASARILKCDPESQLKSKRGKHGGTWAIEQIALEYAQYLSPELAVLVNQAFLERLEEERNPELALQRGTERAVRGWKKQGKSDKWIEERIQGVAQRKSFTATLSKHGVEREGFRNCTNAIYTPLFGGTTEVVRHKKGLPDKASVRDNLNKVELGAVRFAELLAEEKIEQHDLRGNAECELACTKASKLVAESILKNRIADLNPA